MKYFIVIFFIAFWHAPVSAQTNSKVMEGKLLRHIVLFKFKDTSSIQGVQAVENAFRALPSMIKEIKSFEWGLNNSPEKFNQGFTHCFYVTFSSESDRDVYLQHSDHKAFGKVLNPYLEKVLVFDYWAKP